MTADIAVYADALREEVRSKYREVAINPHGEYHFHTGRPLAAWSTTIQPLLMLCLTRPSNHLRAW
jgi:hypothetical protein